MLAESVVLSPDGRLTMLDKYGHVWQAAPPEHPTAGPSGFALRRLPVHLGPGRPLGAEYDAAGDLIVCDALKGLIKVALDAPAEAAAGSAGERYHVGLLTSRVSDDSPLAPGSPILYANDLDIARDGTIYFSDSQDIPVARGLEGSYDTLESYMQGLYACGKPTGRVLTYEPSTGRTRVLVEGIWYANGVALSADESFVAFVETNMLRVRRLWLKVAQLQLQPLRLLGCRIDSGIIYNCIHLCLSSRALRRRNAFRGSQA